MSQLISELQLDFLVVMTIFKNSTKITELSIFDHQLSIVSLCSQNFFPDVIFATTSTAVLEINLSKKNYRLLAGSRIQGS